MAITTKAPMRSVGVGAQYICMSTGFAAETGVPTYATDITKLNTVTKIDTTETRSMTKVHASNRVYDEDVVILPPTHAVENVAFPPATLAAMKGITPANGFEMPSTYDVAGYFAHGIVYPKKNGHFRYVWYPLCKLVDANNSAQTADDSGPQAQPRTVNIQTYTFDDEGHWEVAYDTEYLGESDTPVTEAEFFAAPLLAPITPPAGGE